MNRRFLPLAAAVVLVVIGAVWANSSEDSPRPAIRPRTYKPDVAEGRTAAGEACEHFERFLEAVERDEPADTALDFLDRFERTASMAYDRDVVWLRLLSAAKALGAGVRDDDAETTAVGLGLARRECAPLTG